MKKNNLFLLGLTSLLTLASLAACGNKNDPSSVGPSSQDTSVTSSADPSSESQSVAPSSSEAPSSSQAPSSSEAPSSSQASSSSQAPSSSIEVSSMAPIPDYFRVNAPEVLVVGQTVNLDNYVTAVGEGVAPNTFNVKVKSVSEDVVEVKDHMLTVLKEGAVSLTICYEGVKDAKFTCDAISELKAAFNDATKDLADTFGFYEVNETTDPRTHKTTTTLDPFIRHNSDYLWVPNWEYEDETHKTLLGGGIIRIADGTTHFYTMSKDQKTLTVDPAKQADYSLYYITQPWGLPYTEFTTEQQLDKYGDVDYEYLYMDNTNPFFDDFVDYNMGLGWADGYVSQHIEVMQVVDDDGTSFWEFDVYVAATKSPTVSLGLGFVGVLMDDPADCQMQACEDYINNGLSPEAIKFDSLEAKFNELATVKNYTLTTTTSFWIEDNINGTEEPVAADDPTWDVTSNGWHMVNGDVCVNKVDADKEVATYNGEFDYAFYEQDGQLHYMYNDATGSRADDIVQTSDKLWDNTDADPRTTAVLASNSVLNPYGVFEVNAFETVNGVDYYTVDPQYALVFTDTVLRLSSNSMYLADYAEMYNENYYVDPAEDVPYQYFMYEEIEIAEDYIAINISGQWDQVDGRERTYVYLQYSMVFTNIGTTVVELPA